MSDLIGMIEPVTGMAWSFAVVALGGGAGCAARAAVREVLAARGIAAPFSILGVNLLGAALAGVVAGGALDPGSDLRVAMLAILSGWTTYSAFSTDVVSAFRARRFGRAAILWIGTVAATPVVAAIAARIASGGTS